MTDFKKMQRLVFFVLAFGLANLSFSQSTFRKGYVIKHGGDTLFGLVDYREGARAHKVCEFKLSDGQNASRYEPGDIMGYGFVNGRAYETKRIKDADEKYVTAFLDVKIVGVVSLYKYETSLFVQKGTDSLQRLSNDKKSIYINGKLVEKPSNRHISILNTLLFDCSELRTRTSKIILDERLITTLIEDYNKCKGTATVTLNAAKPWAKAKMGFTTGLLFSQLGVDIAPAGYEYLEGRADLVKTIFAGISIDVSSPRLSERFSFHSELVYLHPTYRLETTHQGYNYKYLRRVELETHQITIPLGARYVFTGKNVIPFVNAGISSTLNFGSHSSMEQEQLSTPPKFEYYEDIWNTRTMQMGFWGGAGIIASLSKKLEAVVELRYEVTQSLLDKTELTSAISSDIKNLKIVLGIRRK